MRTYTVGGGQAVDASGGDDEQTQLTLTNANDIVVRLLAIRVGQQTHATAQMYLLELQRTSDAGTGGSTPTPEKHESGDAASSVAARAGPAVEPTYTGIPLLSRVFNSTLGTEKVWRADKAPVLSPSAFIGAKVGALSGTTAFTPFVEIDYEEIG